MQPATDDAAKKPSFIHAGAQKCATTWWYNCMKEHPQIFLGSKNTIRYFEKPCYDQHDWGWYLGHFKGAREGQQIGEARVEYIYNIESPGLIRKHLPDCKLIFQLRDPVDRAVSACRYNLRRGNIPDEPLVQALRNAVHASSGGAAGANGVQPRIIRMGFYAEQLERYFGCFPMRQILILLYDDIQRDPLSCIQASQRFLGIEPMRPRHLLGRPLQSADWPILNKLERKTRRIYGSAKLWVWCNRAALKAGMGKSPPTLDPSLKAALQELYTPHNRRLRKLLNEYRQCKGAVSGHFGAQWPDWIQSA